MKIVPLGIFHQLLPPPSHMVDDEDRRLQKLSQQPYRHFDPNTDIGFIAYNMRRIETEHPERQQLILNTMNANFFFRDFIIIY
ncbi:unnamed protein product [Caenorhabditis nigoni]